MCAYLGVILNMLTVPFSYEMHCMPIIPYYHHRAAKFAFINNLEIRLFVNDLQRAFCEANSREV